MSNPYTRILKIFNEKMPVLSQAEKAQINTTITQDQQKQMREQLAWVNQLKHNHSRYYIDHALLQQTEEKVLVSILDSIHNKLYKLLKISDYQAIINMYVSDKLSYAINNFFDNVTINCNDSAVKANRICIARETQRLTGLICDPSMLVPRR